MAGDLVVMDLVQGQLKSHPRGAGIVGEWTGFFEYPEELREKLREGNRYRLILIDGRSGHVHVHLKQNDSLERTLAEFHGTGSFRH